MKRGEEFGPHFCLTVLSPCLPPPPSLHSLAFWYGGRLVRNGEIEAGDILISLFAVMIGFSALGQSVTHLQRLSAGRVAATSIFEIIDRTPTIDNIGEEGWKPERDEQFTVGVVDVQTSPTH